MRARAWLSCLAGLLPAGCAFFLDTGSLSGGNAGDGGDAGPLPVVQDADVDADADAAPLPRFCARSAHMFCADFEGSAVDEGWTDKSEDLGGSVSLVAWPGLDGSRSLFATMPRRGTEKGYASLDLRVDGPWSRLRLEADVFLEPPAFEAGDVNFGILCFGYYAGSTQDGVCMSVAAQQIFFAGDTPAVFPSNRWVHARIDVDPGARRVVGDVDTLHFDGPFNTPSGSGARSTVIQIGVLGYNAPSPEARIHIDNVTLDPF